MADEVVYSADLPSQQLVEQGRANVLRCPLRRGGQIEPPASGTITIYDETGTALVNAAATALSGGVQQYVTGTFATNERSMGWRFIWALTAPDGHVHTYRCPGGLVKTIPFPTLSDGSIFRRADSLNPLKKTCVHSRKTLQPLIDEAWEKTVVPDLEKGGTWAHLVYNAAKLEEAHHHATLALLFDELGILQPAFLAVATHHRKLYDEAFVSAEVSYDDDDDGEPDTGSKPARGSLWLCGR